MKRLALLLTTLLCCVCICQAQDNPFKINNECYSLYKGAENAIGKPEFEQEVTRLLDKSIECKDTKAETLVYVLLLRHQKTTKDDMKVNAAADKLREVALRTGNLQYYFFAYATCVPYYYNSDRKTQGMNLAYQMNAEAVKMGNDYGKWDSLYILSGLYGSIMDYQKERECLLNAIETYQNSTDETLKAQSLSKVYFDLASTYSCDSEEFQKYMDEDEAYAKTRTDSTKLNYLKAMRSASLLDSKEYAKYKALVLEDRFHDRYMTYSDVLFDCVDSFFRGDYEGLQKTFQSKFKAGGAYTKEGNLLRDMCHKARAFETEAALERTQVENLASVVSSSNSTYLVEMNAKMGNDKLNSSLAIKEKNLRTSVIVILIIVALLLAALAGLAAQWALNMRKKKELAEKANLQKTRFVQNMSHDIRTPLNAIVGFAQLLGLPDGTLSEQEKEQYNGYIANNCSMLTMLINDILDLSDVDSGNYRIILSECDPDTICHSAMNTVSYRIPSGVSLLYNTDIPLDYRFTSDNQRIQQVLVNYLTNACKHTTKGSITVASSLKEHPGYVTFSVADTGTGVPADQAENIFKRFAKLDSFKQGSGLGLNICTTIAEKLHGVVKLDTTYTGGARFIIMVPEKQPEGTEA